MTNLRLGRCRGVALAIVAGLLLTAAPASAGFAGPAGPDGGHPSGSALDRPVPTVPGLPPVAPAVLTVPRPLPKMSGKVPLRSSLRIRPATRTVAPSASDPAAIAAAAATPATAKFALRALVVAVDDSDFGVATWKATLDRVGAAYDVLYTQTTPLTSDMLVRADGTGRYNAILLTNNMLLYPDASGNYVSGLTGDEWNLLWAYERDYGIRQATLYNSYGTFPEDYCLRAGSEGGVGDTALTTTLTSTGANLLNYLKSSARIPIAQSYVYSDQLVAGCSAQPVLTAGSSVLGVVTTSTDGRERLSLTFTSNQYLLQANLLTYGLFRWATHGLFLGEQRHSLNVDVDDWFNSSDELQADGTYKPEPGYQMSAHDAYNANVQQSALRSRYTQAGAFTFGMAFNGGDANLNAGSTCSPNGGVNQLTATSRCLRNNFRWINHTLTHPKMNFTDYATNRTEISQNLVVAQTLGLPVDGTVLKTPEYSGLGVYNPDPNNDIDPPTDHGLGASNTALLQAAKDLGVKYLHGNMSFQSQVPACFNCGIVHPLEPSLMVVPDWPTNIAYFSTTPAEETYFYNMYYGPNGRFPFWPTDRTYSQIIEYETDQALNHLSTGSIYTHTFHIGNLRDYGSGRTLTTDWADRLIAKYTSYYAVPLLTQGWPALAAYSSGRNAHFAELGAGVDGVYDRGANRVTVTSPAAGSVTISGSRTAGFTTYGSEVSARITLAANTPVTFTPSLLP
jgi:hypothetical protein